MEEWKIFTDRKTGRELCAYTVRGTFPGEEEATIELLAAKNGIPADQIVTETRQAGRIINNGAERSV